ncbi:hypothetical protein [Oerskovia paurometabola]|uniref:Type IV toxin-antitoxin system AbiEi family antitoxin domain-containing protein n=1 Tax=Oerskovia paurometabola TaxID=162170 RepID=A0ABW1X971_9CELL|nr:hypothetical protein [Oerskovia paurometabola]MBM7498982.1 hypothetical protein [Oerskovia paurometabola]
MRHLSPVPEELLVVARRQEGLVSAAQCEEHGLRSHRRSRLVEQRRWTQVTRGVYDIDPVPPARREGPGVPDHRRRRAAWAGLLAFGPEAIAVGPCAVALLGIQGLPLQITAQAALPGGRATGSRDGILLRQFDDGMTVTRVVGRYVATPDWALAQTVPEVGRRTAVALMDSAQHRGLLDVRGLDRAHDMARGRRGVARTHSWWEISDRRAESPLETLARLDCLDAGVPPDELQVVISGDEGQFLARGDLGWRLPDERWLIAEVDGAEVHGAPEALFVDRRRQNLLVASRGVALLRFTARDLAVVGRVGLEIRAFLDRARRSVRSRTGLRPPSDG